MSTREASPKAATRFAPTRPPSTARKFCSILRKMRSVERIVKGLSREMSANRTENGSPVFAPQAEALHHPVERPPVDAEDFRRAAAVALERGQHVPHVALLHLPQRRQAVEHRLLQRRRRARAEGGRQVLEMDGVAADGQGEALDC